MKLAIFKDGFWLFLLASVGAHTAFFLVVPDPLKQAEKITEMEIVGTVPVVALPKKNAMTSKLSQIPKQDIPSSQPNRIPKEDIPKSTLSTVLDVPQETKPEKTVKEPIKSEPKPTKKSEPKPAAKSEPKITKAPDKPDPLDPQNPQKELQADSPTKTDRVQEPQDLNTKKPDVEKTDASNSDLETEQPTSGVTLSRDQFRREFGRIYAEYAGKYGPENVVQRIIPSPQETTVSQVSQTIEPGVEWIPPLEQPQANDLKGKNTKVTVTFIVDPKGKVVKKSMFSSENSNVDAIVKKTVAGYESKFTPLEGKIRIVTINYDFSG
jgi:outer membrane biosynthesis protein TonB